MKKITHNKDLDSRKKLPFVGWITMFGLLLYYLLKKGGYSRSITDLPLIVMGVLDGIIIFFTWLYYKLTAPKIVYSHALVTITNVTSNMPITPAKNGLLSFPTPNSTPLRDLEVVSDLNS